MVGGIISKANSFEAGVRRASPFFLGIALCSVFLAVLLAAQERSVQTTGPSVNCNAYFSKPVSGLPHPIPFENG